jgi:hypothetical protein
LSSSFSIENDSKEGDALLPLLFNIAIEYAFRKVQETNLGLDMNGTHQVLAYADDVNLIDSDIRTIERNANVLLNVNIGTTKYMELGHRRITMADKHVTEDSNSCENVKTF